MGFKRVLLQRVQITEDHTLVNMDDDGPSATRKPTDFSIKRILSENKESVEQNVKEIALNSEVNANQLAWNNYYRFLLPYYAHHQHQQQNHHYQLLANRMQQLTPPVTGATAGLYGSFNGLHQAHHLLKSYATPHPTQIPLPPNTTHPLYPSLRIEMLNSMKAKQLIQTVNQPKLSTAGGGITVKSEKSLTNEINNNCDMDKMLKYEPIPIKEELYCYKCKICDKVFENLIIMEAHEKSHKTTRYECEECGKGFSQLRNYKYHISVHRGTKEFAAKCPECGKVFNDKGYLSSHLKIHRNKKEYACPHCPKCFNQRVAFNMHVRIHTGVKPHICQECGKRFSRKMLLKQHLRTHSGEKPYQCAVCGKTFADRSNMTLHHKLHSGVKPFACPICPKAFTKKHHLKTHLNYHTGCKPYRCPHPNCNQSFTQSSNMRTHSKKCQFRPIDSTCL